VYATCLFCHTDLGRNEAIEHFPVGRRLAFDPARGRLWVVCPKCARWNLTPLEERWEAIEEAERLFRDSRKRVSTDEIGLARVQDGTDLVRIGSPQRPEMAAWRYGEQFTRRRRRHLAIVAGATVLGGGLVVGGLAAGVFSFTVYQLGQNGWQLLRGSYNRMRTVARFTDAHGEERRISRALVKSVAFSEDPGVDGWILSLTSAPVGGPVRRVLRSEDDERFATLDGAEARRVASVVLAHVNRAGGGSDDVTRAVQRLEGGADFAALARRASRLRADDRDPLNAHALPPATRFALEMSLHEEDERRWLEGELYELEQRWREAEVIAGIADSLTLPPGIEDRIAAEHGKRDRPREE
jgi:hypothetical protein